jgi:hypothetical protein
MVPLFFARADGSDGVVDLTEAPTNGIDSNREFATWYWVACIGLALSFVVAVAAVAKRHGAEPKEIATLASAATCSALDDGESIQVVCTPAKTAVRHSVRVRRSIRPASI